MQALGREERLGVMAAVAQLQPLDGEAEGGVLGLAPEVGDAGPAVEFRGILHRVDGLGQLGQAAALARRAATAGMTCTNQEVSLMSSPTSSEVAA